MSDQDHDLAAPPPPPKPGTLEPSPAPAVLDAGLQGHIGRYLRHLYDDVVQQPVPDRFVQLLEELERKSGKQG